jgi:NADPH:quinone reductase-like Zn-dependent oxidoreductase
MMRGITVKEFGGPEKCVYSTSLPIPEPNENQIQIKVYAAGVNPVDTVRNLLSSLSINKTAIILLEIFV